MSTGTRKYTTHGFTFESAIELPELTDSDSDPDVTIRYGSVPRQLAEPIISSGRYYQTADGQYLLDMPGVARYWVSNGREVIIELASGADLADVRIFLLSSVMGALAHQRGVLTLHASAVEIDGRSVLFAGKSGTGKSTLAAAFCDRGNRIVTDDISVVRFDHDGDPVVHGGHRYVKLWPDSLERVGSALGARRKPRVGIQKYNVTTPELGSGVALPLACVFVLSARSAPAIILRTLTGRSKITALVTATYRRRMLTALGQSNAHFARCAELARKVAVVAVERPFALDTLGGLVDVFQDTIRGGGELS